MGWMVVLSAGMLLCLTCFFVEYFLTDGMLTVFVYVSSRRNSKAMVQLLGLNMRFTYLPWAYGAMSFFMGGSLQDNLMGIFVGHVYYFFEDIYPVLPRSQGVRIFKTP